MRLFLSYEFQKKKGTEQHIISENNISACGRVQLIPSAWLRSAEDLLFVAGAPSAFDDDAKQ